MGAILKTMRGAARVGDLVIGTCFNVAVHTVPIPTVGIIVTGNPTTLTNGLPAAKTGDMVIWCCCGCAGVVIGTSFSSILTGQIRAVQGDPVVGIACGNIAMVSPNHFAF